MSLQPGQRAAAQPQEEEGGGKRRKATKAAGGRGGAATKSRRENIARNEQRACDASAAESLLMARVKEEGCDKGRAEEDDELTTHRHGATGDRAAGEQAAAHGCVSPLPPGSVDRSASPPIAPNAEGALSSPMPSLPSSTSPSGTEHAVPVASSHAPPSTARRRLVRTADLDGARRIGSASPDARARAAEQRVHGAPSVQPGHVPPEPPAPASLAPRRRLVRAAEVASPSSPPSGAERPRVAPAGRRDDQSAALGEASQPRRRLVRTAEIEGSARAASGGALGAGGASPPPLLAGLAAGSNATRTKRLVKTAELGAQARVGASSPDAKGGSSGHSAGAACPPRRSKKAALAISKFVRGGGRRRGCSDDEEESESEDDSLDGFIVQKGDSSDEAEGSADESGSGSDGEGSVSGASAASSLDELEAKLRAKHGARVRASAQVSARRDTQRLAMAASSDKGSALPNGSNVSGSDDEDEDDSSASPRSRASPSAESAGESPLGSEQSIVSDEDHDGAADSDTEGSLEDFIVRD